MVSYDLWRQHLCHTQQLTYQLITLHATLVRESEISDVRHGPRGTGEGSKRRGGSVQLQCKLCLWCGFASMLDTNEEAYIAATFLPSFAPPCTARALAEGDVELVHVVLA